MYTEILKDTANYHFSLHAYNGGFMETIPPEWLQNKGRYPVSLLKSFIEKSGRRWPDTLINDYAMRLTTIIGDKMYFTATVWVKEFATMITRVENMQSAPRKRSVRIMDFLTKCETKWVALVFQMKRPGLVPDKNQAHQVRALKEQLGYGLSKGQFKPFDAECLRRGSYIQDRKGNYGVVFAGFPLTNEEPEGGSPLQVLMLDRDEEFQPSLRILVADTGQLPDGSVARICTDRVCEPKMVDRLYGLYIQNHFYRNGRVVSPKFGFDQALALAANYYSGVVDMGHEPYLLHVLRVTMEMRNEAQRMVALLHDALCVRPAVSIAQLLNDGVPIEVIRSVVSLQEVQGEGYYDYIYRLRRDPVAICVKKACLRDDMNLARLPNEPTEEDNDRKCHMLRTYNLLTIKP